MIENNSNIKIKGFVFKKVPTILKVIGIWNVIIHIVCLVLVLSNNKTLGNAIFSSEMLFLIIYWVIYNITQRKELKVEDGVLYFNNEEIRLKSYKRHRNENYLEQEDEKFLFYANSNIKPTRFDRIQLRENLIKLDRYLQNEKIPIENSFGVLGKKLFYLVLGTIILPTIMTAILETILKLILK